MKCRGTTSRHCLPLVAVAAFIILTFRAVDLAPTERVIVRAGAAAAQSPPPPLPLPQLTPAGSPSSPTVTSPPSASPWRLGRPVLVFSGGQEGYKVFRIPALCRAAKALLAFAEARPSVEDSGSIDLVMRRSTDGGRSWSGLKQVVTERQLSAAAGVVGGLTVGNPVPIFLSPTSRYPEGRLLLLFCSHAASVDEDAIRADATVAAGAGRRVWLSRSDDGGAAWSPPREITSQVHLGEVA